MKTLIVLFVLVLAGCGDHSHELAQTSKHDPIWVLNDGKWTFNENALTTVPSEGPRQ